MAPQSLTLAEAGYVGLDDPVVIADPDLDHRLVLLGHVTPAEANRRITASPSPGHSFTAGDLSA